MEKASRASPSRIAVVIKGGRMNIEEELEALHDNLLANTELRYVSKRQLGGLNGLIRQGLEHKSRMMRMAVLEKWAGKAMKKLWNIEKFDSSKCLTSSGASFLINQLIEPDTHPWELSRYGRELVEETEKLVLKEKYGVEQLEIPIEEK
ncbi:MAG: hypothetical protein ACP5D6_11405 [Kosmotogaceae bacterium]